MMKKILYILAALATVAAAASCKKEVIPDELDITNEDELSIAALGGNVSISVSANNPVSLTIDSEWLEANTYEWTPDPEKKTKSVFFYAEKNESVDERTACVTVSAGSLTRTVEIIQAGKTTIIADENSFSIDEKGGEISVPVKTNVKCSVDTRCDWVSLAETKALEDKTFILSVAPNTTDKERSASVLISGLGETRTVSVTQSAGAVFEIQSATANFDADGGKFLDIAVRTNVGLSLVSAPEWISAEVDATDAKAGEALKSPVNVKVRLTASVNLRHEARSGEINLAGIAREGLSAKISAEQSASPFCVYFTTTEKTVSVPLFYGNDVSGKILWGDGSSNSYKSTASHTFSSGGEHTVCVTIGDAELVHFAGIKNITRIDLRSF